MCAIVCAALFGCGLLSQGGVLLAQGAPAANRTAVSQRPLITGMAKGYEKVVALTEDRPPYVNPLPGGLLRELMRQALLIAAEEELGLVTLDDSIGELIPAGTAAAGPLTLRSTAVRRKPGPGQKPYDETPIDCTITITRPEFNGQVYSWSSPQLTLQTKDDYETFVEQTEALSRGSFVEALQKAGFEKSNAQAVEVPDPKLQNRLDFVSQFATVRYYRSRMGRGDENSESLEGLIRAYANLGSLIDFHWSPASKACKARSLLYAQRLITKNGPTPSSLAHRAYALALAGRHGAAQQAIDAARKADGKEAPGWMSLIEAYCAYNPDVVEQVKGTDQELAQYLRISMIDLRFDLGQSSAAFQKFLKVNPANCRAADLLSSMPAIGIQRNATEVLFNDTWPGIYERLAAVPDLPGAAKKVVDTARGRKVDIRSEAIRRKELMSGLLPSAEAKKVAGPSWACMATMLRDVSFAQAWRTLSTEVNILGIRSEASLQRQKALVTGHRLEKMLDLFSRNERLAHETIEQFNIEDNRAYLDVSAVPLGNQYMRMLGMFDGDIIVRKIDFNTDELYEDAYRRLQLPFYGPDAPDLEAISPKWPQSVSETVKRSGLVSLSDVEEKYHKSVVVLQALYERHHNDGHPDDAKRCLKKAIDLAPTCESYMNLAELYQQEDDREQWQQALAKALKLPTQGLDHAEAHYQLAVWLMRQGKWPAAKPHVTKAVESNASFALWTGSRYAEGVENWLEAERYQQQASKRYEGASPDWYFWCLRTGRGKVKEAKALAVNYWTTRAGALDINQKWGAVVGHLADNDQAKAQPFLEDLARTQSKAAVLIAVLADESNDTARRNEWLLKVATTRVIRDPFVELVNLFRGVLSGKETARWNPVAFETLAVNATEEDVPYLYLIAGKFLDNHDEKRLAKEYLLAAATPFRTDNLAAVIAADSLRKQKVQVGKARLNALPDTIAPQGAMLANARWHQKHGKLDEAETILNQLLKNQSSFVPGLLARASVYESQGRYAEALADLEGVINASPQFDRGYNDLSRLLATCPDDAIRNGPKALEYAEHAASLRQFETAVSLKTLAWAHAECGQFEKAIELETQTRKLPDGADPGTNDRLNLFRARQPYRGKGTTGTVAAAPAAPPRPVSFETARIGEWVNLLEWTADVDWSPLGIPWNDHLEGSPSKQGITLRNAPHRRFPLACVVDGDYELEVEFKRVSGHEPVAVYFPVGIHTLRLLLDVESSASVSFVEGQEFGKRRHAPLAGDKSYRVAIQVRSEAEKSSFKIDWDGNREFITWSGDTDSLRNYDTSEWSTNMIRRPWVGSSNNSLVVQTARLRMSRGTVRRDPMTDGNREQDRQNGFVRLVGEPATNATVGAWSFCINQIPLELSGIGAECRWPMIAPRFEFCNDYVGAHAPSRVGIPIPATAKSFSTVAYNDSSRIEKYRILIDGKETCVSQDTGVAVMKVDVPANSKLLELVADPLGDSAYDHTFWCYPRFHTVSAERVADKMLDDPRSGPILNISAGTAEGDVTRSKPTGDLKSGPISFRDFQPCDEFIFAHAPSTVTFQVPEGMTRFTATGYNVIGHSARFEVWADGKRILESPDAGVVPIDVRLPPTTRVIELKTNDCGNAAGDQCIWCYPRLNRK